MSLNMDIYHKIATWEVTCREYKWGSLVDPNLCENEMKHRNMIGTQKCKYFTFYY